MRRLILLLLLLAIPSVLADCPGQYPFFLHNFSNQVAFEGVPFVFDVNATDPLHPLNLTYGILTSPGDLTGMAINSTTGFLNFTPSDGDVSSHLIQYYVQNDVGCVNQSQLLTFTVRDAPNITAYLPPTRTPSMTENSTLRFNVTLYDRDAGDAFSYLWSIDGGMNSSVPDLNYTPGFCDAGIHNISVHINDSYLLGTNMSWTVTVINFNRPPAVNASIGNFSWMENGFLSNAFRLDAYFYDLDYIECLCNNDPYVHNLTYSAIGNGSTIILIGNETNVSFTALAHWAGNESVRFTAYDGYSTGQSDISLLMVNNTPDPPVIAQQVNISIRKNTYFSVLVNVSDYDDNAPGDTLSYHVNASSPTVNLTKINDTRANLSVFSNDTMTIGLGINVTDSFNLSALMSFILTFRDNLPPVIHDDALTANTTETFIHQLNVTDDDHDTIVCGWSLIDGNSSTFSMDPSCRISFNGLENETGISHINISTTDGTDTVWKNITLTVVSTNYPPVFNQTDIVAFAQQPFALQLNITDPENLSFLVNYSFAGAAPSNFWMNASGFINFTPLDNDSARYILNISADDDFNLPVYHAVNFTLYWANHAPTITLSNWTVALLNATETDTIEFNVTAYDEDISHFDNLSFSWLLDGVNLTQGLGIQSSVGNSSSLSLNLSLGYCTAGIRNLTVLVTDVLNATGQKSWNLSINNTNRPPYFGRISKDNSSFFSGGSFEDTILNGSTIILSNDTGIFAANGTYTSPTIDTLSNEANISAFAWNASTPAGTNITLRTRTSPNNLDWSNWSEPYNTSGETFLSAPERYVQFDANLTASDQNFTPTLLNVTLTTYISNKTVLENTIIDPWIDLDSFFFDPDAMECTGNNKDNLSFSFLNLEHLTVTVDPLTNQVRVIPDTDFADATSFSIRASDANSSVTSNLIGFAFTSITGGSSDSHSTSSSGGGGGGTRYVTQIKQVPKPVPKIIKEPENVTVPKAVDIIAVSPIIMYANDTIIVPIILRNVWNGTLSNIDLDAETNASVRTEFQTSHYDEIAKDAEESTLLTVTSYAQAGTYELAIKARTGNPAFNDSTTIFINSIELGKHSDNLLNTKIAFTRDLLAENPQCLELDEVLSEAVTALGTGDSAKASELVTSVIEACRFIITQANKRVEQPTGSFFNRLASSALKNVTFYGLLAVFVATIGIMLWISTRTHHEKKAKVTKAKEKKREEEESFEPFG